MVAHSTPAPAPPPAGRMAAVQEMARLQRLLFEVEREFILVQMAPHERYGHHWLPQMMALCGETRPVDEFVRATQEKFKQVAALHGNRTPHSLPPATRLTGEKILRMVRS